MGSTFHPRENDGSIKIMCSSNCKRLTLTSKVKETNGCLGMYTAIAGSNMGYTTYKIDEEWAALLQS
jgi:hypothetical protein